MILNQHSASIYVLILLLPPPRSALARIHAFVRLRLLVGTTLSTGSFTLRLADEMAGCIAAASTTTMSHACHFQSNSAGRRHELFCTNVLRTQCSQSLADLHTVCHQPCNCIRHSAWA